jgi:hypothetical protein
MAVMLFPLAEYVMCSRLFTFLYLQHSECCSDQENFEDFPEISRSSRCACLQSAACGGILSAAITRYLCFYLEFGHVITLYLCGTDFGIHNVVVCVCNLILAHM